MSSRFPAPKIKNESYSFFINQSVQSLLNDTSSLPQVMISGLATLMLDWHSVLNILFEKMDLQTTIIDDIDDPVIDDPSRNTKNNSERLGLGYGILSFICPIAGWILGHVWKEQYPTKAGKANRLAWIGFILNILSSFFAI